VSPAEGRPSLGDRIGGVLNWGSVDKCILAAALTLPFLASYLALGRYLGGRPELVGYLDYTVLAVLVDVLTLVTIAWAALLVTGLAWRRRSADSVVLVHATIQLYAISNAFFIYCIGPYTSPLWLVLLGAGMIGFLIFPRRAVLLGLATLLLLEAGATLGERPDPVRSAHGRPPVFGDRKAGELVDRVHGERHLRRHADHLGALRLHHHPLA
jgi:hypothetical protein